MVWVHIPISFWSSLLAFKTPYLVCFIHLKILVNVVRTLIRGGLINFFLWRWRLMWYFFLLLLNVAWISLLFLMMIWLGLSFLLFFNLRSRDPIIDFLTSMNLSITISKRQIYAGISVILLWLVFLSYIYTVHKTDWRIIPHLAVFMPRVESIWYKHAWLFFFFIYVLKERNLHNLLLISYKWILWLHSFSLILFFLFITKLKRFHIIVLAFDRFYTFNYKT